jgi:hypothetical protein
MPLQNGGRKWGRSMPNSNYRKGRRMEYAAKKILEAGGYTVIRAAGSHGPFDLVAVDWSGVILIQVKADCKISKQELDKMSKIGAPPNAAKQIWTYAKGKLEIHQA